MMEEAQGENLASAPPPSHQLPLETKKLTLIQATQYGDFKRIQYLVDTLGEDCTAGDEENITPLHWAAINNRDEIAR